MIDGHGSVRSYQRIFSPERRIHQIEGRPLPVPGGVPLRWVGWALGSLLAVLALGSASLFVAALARTLAFGAVLGVLDWPIRFVVFPVAVATLATQATPDGRRPERFALSWLVLRLAPPRRSLGRALPPTAVRQTIEGELWVSPDSLGPRLRRARITGPALVCLAEPAALRRSLFGRRLVLRGAGRFARPSRLRATVEVQAGRILEVQP